MDQKTCKNHITVLKKVRDVCESQLDIGVRNELNAVIEALESHLGSRERTAKALALTARVAQIIAVIVKILTNIGDWM